MQACLFCGGDRSEPNHAQRCDGRQGRREALRFDGPAYEPDHDQARLTQQLARIYWLMRDGRWRTLAEIEAETHDPPASISAQLRHLRKPRFGSHTVNRRSRGERSRGLYEYQVIVNEARKGIA